MERAVREAFEMGWERVAVIGADCPELTVGYVREAFDALGEDDAAIGPAADGGYTLLALKEARPELFAGMDWGSERVFAQTCSAAAAAGLRLAVLSELRDVDRPEDLPVWEAVRGRAEGTQQGG